MSQADDPVSLLNRSALGRFGGIIGKSATYYSVQSTIQVHCRDPEGQTSARESGNRGGFLRVEIGEG